MAKFTFPLPGRSKKQQQQQQQPAAAPAESMTKAQRILGATEFSVDSTKNWEQATNTAISVAVSETTSPTTNSSGPGYPRRQQPRRDWGDDSDVLPGDAGSDYSSVLREQPSSSTIKSWYDKTKQPLAVSQQTSASAMAKGFPSKAQRVLDMDNAHGTTASKGKKKPAMLDLSKSHPDDRHADQDWDGPVLGNNYVMSSPSILSPLTPNSARRQRRRIQKRPTQESLRQQDEVIPSRPATSDNAKKSPARHFDELPSLYKHYEQMSFAQLMDDEDDTLLVQHSLQPQSKRSPAKAPEWNAGFEEEPVLPETSSIPGRSQRQPPCRQDQSSHGPLNSHPTLRKHPGAPSHSSHSSRSTQRSQPRPASHMSSSVPPPPPVQFIVAPPPTTKMEQQSPIDCGASVSSRHTRTSKASRRTDKSFQTADLQGKSVLNLSSDSEEDEDDDNESLGTPAPIEPVSPTATRPEVTRPSVTVTNSETCTIQSESAGSSHSSQVRQPGPICKRKSSAPAGFLTTYTRLASRSPPRHIHSADPSSDGLQPKQSLHLTSSLSDLSLSAASNSSLSTMMTWQEHEGYGVQEARAITMLPAQGPQAGSEPDMTDSDFDYEEPESVLEPESLSSLSGPADADQAPPLSPVSVEDCLNSPESMDGSHEHMMGLTRQEQALIQALRQKREVMRATSPEDAASRQQSFRKGHQANNPSEVTITESNFNFPTPPSNRSTLTKEVKHSHKTSSMVDLPIPGCNGKDGETSRSASHTADGTMFTLSPPPSHHKFSNNSARNSKLHSTTSRESSRVRTTASEPATRESFSSFGLSSSSSERKPVDKRRTSRSNSRDSLTIPHPRGSVRRQKISVERREEDSLRDDKPPSRRHHQNGDWAIMEEEPVAPSSMRQQHEIPQGDNGPGVPRPDSPISPMANAFPAVPQRRTLNQNQRVRLSAFGPPQALEGETGWWGHED